MWLFHLTPLLGFLLFPELWEGVGSGVQYNLKLFKNTLAGWSAQSSAWQIGGDQGRFLLIYQEIPVGMFMQHTFSEK